MSTETLRLFLALWPDRRSRSGLRACRDAWAWAPGAARVPTEQLHLTLHFLGEQPVARLEALIDAVQVPVTPFELSLGSARLWPGGIAVLEPDTVPAALTELHRALADALQAGGWPTERRAFRPHVTLARRAGPSRPPLSFRSLIWPVRGFALVASRPGPPRHYAVLHRVG